MSAPHLTVGREGETIAATFLQSLGYEIRGRNIRLGKDEIDILAFDPVDSVLVFVEVKSRAWYSERFPPGMNAGYRKHQKIRRSAIRWVTRHCYQGAYRLDLVCVAHGRVIEHFKQIGGD